MNRKIDFNVKVIHLMRAGIRNKKRVILRRFSFLVHNPGQVIGPALDHHLETDNLSRDGGGGPRLLMTLHSSDKYRESLTETMTLPVDAGKQHPCKSRLREAVCPSNDR